MTKKYHTGMFALSGDPMTYGHLDVIKRSLELCDSLIVLIANNGGKAGKYLFTLEERMAIAKRMIEEAHLGNQVTVMSSDGLMFDEFVKYNCDCLIRGVRDEKDECYEREQLEIQRLFTAALPEECVHFMPASEEYRLVSSTLVKGAVGAGLEVDRFVPVFVKELLEERILGQKKIGITGGIGSGKTYVSTELVKKLIADGNAAKIVNFDELQRTLYREKSPAAESIRQKLVSIFGREVVMADGSDVNRPLLAERIFDASCTPETREELSKLVKPHIDRLYRDAIRGFRGVIVLEWAQLVENDLLHLVNNQVIVVDAPADDRKEFLKERNIPKKRLAETLRVQWSSGEKTRVAEDKAREDRHGAVIVYRNRRHNSSEEGTRQLHRLAEKVMELLKS